jgi:hypothetical protein
MGALPRPLGSFTNWAILRLGELVAVACGFSVLFVHRTKLSPLAEASVVGLLLLVPAYFHPFAFGFADDEGITFCRYFKLHFVPWKEVVRVQRRRWDAFEVVILLSKRVALTKIVKFSMNLSRQEIDATFQDRWIPEILTWLIDQLPSTQAPKQPSPLPRQGDRLQGTGDRE